MYTTKYQTVKTVVRSQVLQNYSESFATATTKVAYDDEQKRYIQASLDVNHKFNEKGDWQELPVHFYSHLPQRMDDIWRTMQKRNLNTMLKYIKSLGTPENPILMLTKVSAKGNRYFTITTRAKYNNYRSTYSQYSIETI